MEAVAVVVVVVVVEVDEDGCVERVVRIVSFLFIMGGASSFRI